jgi:hypothetical protein
LRALCLNQIDEYFKADVPVGTISASAVQINVARHCGTLEWRDYCTSYSHIASDYTQLFADHTKNKN